MKADSKLKNITCEYCNTEFIVDDEAKHIVYDNADEAGYKFEKGRQKAEIERLEIDGQIYRKQKKRAIIIGAVLGVLLVLGIVFTFLLRTNQPLYTKLSIALMPETLEYENSDGEDITFYIEENKDFDKEKDDPIEAYKTYYYKDKDKKEKVYLKDGIYMTDKEYAESKRSDLKENNKSSDGVKSNIGQGQMVTVGFLISAQEKANKVRTVVRVIVAIFAVACVAYLIYLWYLNWSKRQDKKAEKLAEAEAILSGDKPKDTDGEE